MIIKLAASKQYLVKEAFTPLAPNSLVAGAKSVWNTTIPKTMTTIAQRTAAPANAMLNLAKSGVKAFPKGQAGHIAKVHGLLG